ncbi:MAG: bifunctional folylpolyglutamate synthase/dihydrofolate synthase [Bacteroidales bacterium]|nr:bifunctional folylpolyglutamate synthase/dihydrofolate synthase [Bacteroidales bacterium]
MVFSESAYGKLLEEIFQRFPSVQKTDFASAYKPGLEGMEAFCTALGNPERSFRSIHVAGTNGKGSVASLLTAALAASGLRTALYTSPHLVDFRERSRIVDASGFSLIPKEYVFDFLMEWKPYFIEHGLSFFEITTGLAFKWFADEKVDAAVIETGLGGRLDSTNVIIPELSVVTTIGLDHCALLGNTLAAIAGEKAGIFKPGVPALVGESNPETDPVFDETSWMVCPLTYADKVRPSLWHRHQDILRKMDLQADVQQKNLRTVLAAVDILKVIPGFKGLADAQAVMDGIARAGRLTGFRGRWERLSEHPFVIADIGHNPQALRYSFDQLRRYVEEGRCSSLIIVYGVMADKDLDGILPLMPADATYVFTAPQTSRALPAADILRRYTAFAAGRSSGAPLRAFAAETVRQAVQMALQLAQSISGRPDSAPPLVFIGGSAFVVAEALPLFG